jgi:hypothetical protein
LAKFVAADKDESNKSNQQLQKKSWPEKPQIGIRVMEIEVVVVSYKYLKDWPQN